MFPLPEYSAVLDFFSPEAKKIASSSPPFTSLPPEVEKRAVGRLFWKTGAEMTVGFAPQEVRVEVQSFFLMCQALASVSHPYSREVRLAGEKTEESIRYRLYHLFSKGYESPCLEVIRRYLRVSDLGELGEKLPRGDLFKLRNASLREAGVLTPPDSVPPQHLPSYSLPWTDLAPLLKAGKVQLTDLYLVGGKAVITPYQLWNFFSACLGLRCEEYVASLQEHFSEEKPPQALVRVGERISSLLPPEVELGVRFPRGRLKPEFFPPCVKRSLAGVGSGARNYAITVLLTSFLSHARLPPSGKVVTRIRDFHEGFSAMKEEILPLIFEAAERCHPPLFRDQPQERSNVYYHLGFGMTQDPRPEDSGKSKWYSPPNCRKISSSVPSLCTPDEICREIRNPLTYYYKRLRLEGRRDGVQKGDARGEKEVLQGGVEQA